MKKQLLFMAAALAIGSTAVLALNQTALMQTLQSNEETTGSVATRASMNAEIENSGYATSDYPFAVTGSRQEQDTWSVYPASVMDNLVNLDKYTITEIRYNLGYKPDYGKMNVSIYGTTTADETLSGVPEADVQTLASDVMIDFSALDENVVRIPLSKPIVLEKGQSLLLQVYATNVDGSVGSAPTCYNYGDGVSTRTYYTMGGYPYDTTYSPAIDFTYVEGEYTGGGEQQKDIDLAISQFDVPYGTFYTDKAYEISVVVRNAGSEDVSNYVVEIFNVETNEVVASSEISAGLNSGRTNTVNLEVSFSTPGTYNLAARVTTEGDINADNNVSDPVAVTVEALPYKAVSITGPSTAATGDTETFTVTVANEGDNPLTGYTVDLCLVRPGVEDKVVATKTDNPEIAAGETAEITFEYTFNLSGDYGFKGVVAVGQNEPSETAVMNVNVPLDKLTPVINEQIPEWDGSSADWMTYILGRNNKFTACQLLYPADYFGNHEHPYQLQALTFTLREDYANVPPMYIKIYLAQTDQDSSYSRDERSSLVPESEFELVYEGAVSPDKVDPENFQDLTINLQKVYSLENGKNLAINIVSFMPYGGSGFLYPAVANTDDYYQAYTYNDSGDDDFSIYNSTSRMFVSKQLPCLTFSYALEPLPAEVDLAVTNFEQTSDTPTADQLDEPVKFRVTIDNVGTVDIADGDYNIEIVNVNEDGTFDVLDTIEGTRFLAAGSSSNQTVSFQFPRNGKFNIAARVVTAGDIDSTNDISDTIEFNVDWSTAADVLFADGTLSYDVATSTLRVNVGEGRLAIFDMTGSTVVAHNLKGATELRLDLPAGIYIVNAKGKTIKIRK